MHTQDFPTEAFGHLFVPREEGPRPVGRANQIPKGEGAEALEVKRRLGNFRPELSEVARRIQKRFPTATKNELVSVVQMAIQLARERLSVEEQSIFNQFDRVVRRRTALILKFLVDNWGILCEFLSNVYLADADGNVIKG
jgi:hypothetical protein